MVPAIQRNSHSTAAVDAARQRWRTRRPGKTASGDLFKHEALARIFRAKIMAAIAAAGLTTPACHPNPVVAASAAIGGGKATTHPAVRNPGARSRAVSVVHVAAGRSAAALPEIGKMVYIAPQQTRPSQRLRLAISPAAARRSALRLTPAIATMRTPAAS
ncbi:MAG TPA: hypothetical protein PK752_20485 [Accumulibacter sp.]|uniref:hypothetical protein n=1 Tax=Accumulibacter sp. TaxID=2053492 RepID=UPI002D1CC965|nr:hypothetical protein [Accumulibacter sp.]HRD90608.1 hypothetical protein [Accumulibacter sp.]